MKKAKKAKTEAVPATAQKAAVTQPMPVAGPSKIANQDDDDSDGSASEVDLSTLVHESLAQPKRTRPKTTNTKYTPPDETQADRDRRTLFVGNLPIDVAKSKPALHQLKAHILTFAPRAKIESVRFRSVAFAAPTAALPDDEEGQEGKRQKREMERARRWKEEQEVLKEGGKEAEEVDPTKSYLDNKGKRKVAFIKKEVS